MEHQPLHTFYKIPNPEFINQAGLLFDADYSSIESAFSIAIASILSGLVYKLHDDENFDKVIAISNSYEINHKNIFQELKNHYQYNKFTSKNLLKILFDKKDKELFEIIAQVSGLNISISKIICEFSAVLSLSYLNESFFKKKDLISYLEIHKKQILEHTPFETKKILDFSKLEKNSKKANLKKYNFIPKWCYYIFVLLLITVFLNIISRTKIKEIRQNIEKINELQFLSSVPKENYKNIILLEDHKKIAYKKFVLPNNQVIVVPKTGIENNMISWILNNDSNTSNIAEFTNDQILFKKNTNYLDQNGEDFVKNIAEMLLAIPNLKIKIDINNPNNYYLSELRAETITDFLLKFGVAKDRISTYKKQIAEKKITENQIRFLIFR